MSPRVKQILMIVATAAIGATIEVFSKPGPWSHAFWLPVVMALLTELRTAIGLQPAPNAPTAAEVKARITGAVPPVGILVLVALLGLTACKATVPGTPDGPVAVAEQCAVKATHDVAVNIIGDVQTALASGSWEAGLVDLVAKWGVDAVKCAVAEVTRQADIKASGTADPVLLVVSAHGHAWLASH